MHILYTALILLPLSIHLFCFLLNEKHRKMGRDQLESMMQSDERCAKLDTKYKGKKEPQTNNNNKKRPQKMNT